MDNKIYTKFNRPKKVYEKIDNKKVVDPAGYISAQKRIENLINAGQRLVLGRKEQYDFEGEIPEDHYDPTRSKNYDIVDAKIDFINAIERVSTRQKNKKLEAQNDVSKKLSTVPSESGSNSGSDNNGDKLAGGVASKKAE